ncbi:hypothetical protein WMY93_021363 [Mugilogobius chulae]|uniref:Uncharacterized protein n=1 Tax=Mugilogobius chulae TaxID=88201 RepID=A0AAW0NHM3_9GOBI
MCCSTTQFTCLNRSSPASETVVRGAQELPGTALVWRQQEDSAQTQFEQNQEGTPQAEPLEGLHWQENQCQQHMEDQEKRRTRRNGRKWKENLDPEERRASLHLNVQAEVRNSAPCRQKQSRVRAEAQCCSQSGRVKTTVARSAITGVLHVTILREQTLVHIHIQEVHRLTHGLSRPQRPLRQQKEHTQGCYVQVWLTSDPRSHSRTPNIRSSRPSCPHKFTV